MSYLGHLEKDFSNGFRYSLTGKWVTLFDPEGCVHCHWIFTDEKMARKEFLLRVEEMESFIALEEHMKRRQEKSFCCELKKWNHS